MAPRVFSRNVVLVLPLVLLALWASPLAHAQNGVLLGPVVTYRFGVPLELVRDSGRVNGLPARGIGTSYANTIAAGLDAILRPWDLRGPAIGLRLEGDFTRGLFYSATQTGDRVFDPLTQTIVPSTSRTTITVFGWRLGADARAAFGLANDVFGGRLEGEIGLWGSGRLGVELQARRAFLGPVPLGAAIQDSAIQVPVAPGNPIRYGVGAGAAWTLNIAREMQLRAQVGARLDLPALVDAGLGIRALQAQGGLAVLFDLAPGPMPLDSAPGTITPPLARDTSPPVRTDTSRTARDTAARPTTLSASIDLYALDDAGAPIQSATVRDEIVQCSWWMPMPVALYFDSGQATIPARYARSTPEQAARFSPNELVRRSPGDIHRHMLDLVGYRLRGRDGVRLQLRAAGADALGRARAEAVRHYLGDVWGVDSSRIEIAAAQAGIPPDELRVTLVGPASAPLVIEWHERAYRLPLLDVRPEITASAGVRRWAVTVRQEDQVITSYSSSAMEATAVVSLRVPDNINGGPLPPLIAEFVVDDSTGATFTARDTLPLSLVLFPASDRRSVSRERLEYLFTGSGREATVRAIASAVRAGDQLSVAGPGASEAAASLDGLRAKRSLVVRIVRDHALSALAGGIHPEDTLYASAAIITLERSVPGR